MESVDFAANQNIKSGYVDQCVVFLFDLKKFRIDLALTFRYVPEMLAP